MDPYYLTTYVLSPRNVYHFQVSFGINQFLAWEEGQTVLIKVGALRRPAGGSAPRMFYRKRYIPVVYAQLLHQLCTEIGHAHTNTAHEAQRRAAYAEQVTDLFGDEIYSRRDLSRPGNAASSWRSKVMTPIIQRQIAGVPDAYLPALHAGVLDPENDDPEVDDDTCVSREMTIAEATTFYLDADPADPALIPEYRRNLLYSRELRWYLTTLLDDSLLENIGWYQLTIWDQDELSHVDSEEHMDHEPDTAGDTDGPPPLGIWDTVIIWQEGLEGYFKEEIDAAVCAMSLLLFTGLCYSIVPRCPADCTN